MNSPVPSTRPGRFKKTLSSAQHGKCAFCESRVRHVAYGDVEHFRPKAGYCQTQNGGLRCPGYYWLAYDWTNLFFTCQLCNQRFKKNHFPLKDENKRARSHKDALTGEQPLLIDPSRTDPADFIEFREERAHAINGSAEGVATIEILGLNRPELVEARGKRLQDLRCLSLTQELLREKLATLPNSEISTQLREVGELLQQSRADAGEYAAMARQLT